MTINMGQFGGVFWHDPEKGEQEVVNPNDTRPVQGMLFHPLTSTGIPGDPLMTTIGRERDVRDAFGISFPQIERSGIPRSDLGTQETNPRVAPVDRRKTSAGGYYDPNTNTMHLRDEADEKGTAETPIHELGHARDRGRMKGVYAPKKGYVPELEGAADAFEDRFSPKHIMRPSGSFDPKLNPERAAEMMREPISDEPGGKRLNGYGGLSYVWRDKVDQAIYLIERMRGSMSPTGRNRIPTKLPQGDFGWGSGAQDLSDVQLTAPQRKQHELGSEIKNKPGYAVFNTRGEATALRTMRIGREYKRNESVRALLDAAGLSDMGNFASRVHDLSLERKRSRRWNEREAGRRRGRQFDRYAELGEEPSRRLTGDAPLTVAEYMDDPRYSVHFKRALRQPSLFEGTYDDDDHDIVTKYIDPQPKETELSLPDTQKETTRGALGEWMKANKIKKPGKRAPSKWQEMKDAEKAVRQHDPRDPFRDFFRF